MILFEEKAYQDRELQYVENVVFRIWVWVYTVCLGLSVQIDTL